MIVWVSRKRCTVRKYREINYFWILYLFLYMKEYSGSFPPSIKGDFFKGLGAPCHSFCIYFSLYNRYIHTSFIHKYSLRPISTPSQLSARWAESPSVGCWAEIRIRACLKASQLATNWVTLHERKVIRSNLVRNPCQVKVTAANKNSNSKFCRLKIREIPKPGWFCRWPVVRTRCGPVGGSVEACGKMDIGPRYTWVHCSVCHEEKLHFFVDKTLLWPVLGGSAAVSRAGGHRLPARFPGMCSLYPTSGRLPRSGCGRSTNRCHPCCAGRGWCGQAAMSRLGAGGLLPTEGWGVGYSDVHSLIGFTNKKDAY